MYLSKGKLKKQYVIKEIVADEEMEKFLFTLGCYKGEEITIISRLASNYVINVKNERYAIDENLAKSIVVE